MRLWLLWVLATGVAFGVGGRLGGVLSPSRDAIVTGYFAVSISLLFSGVLQWIILRRPLAGAGWWIPASFVAVAAVGVLVFGVGFINRDVGWVLGVVLGWIVLGVLQWLVLREHVAGAGWWVPAHSLGLIVAIPVVAFVTWIAGVPADGTIGGFLRWLAFGAAYGVVSGTALSLLLREQL